MYNAYSLFETCSLFDCCSLEGNLFYVFDSYGTDLVLIESLLRCFNVEYMMTKGLHVLVVIFFFNIEIPFCRFERTTMGLIIQSTEPVRHNLLTALLFTFMEFSDSDLPLASFRRWYQIQKQLSP